jgi:hypothetical protein
MKDYKRKLTTRDSEIYKLPSENIDAIDCIARERIRKIISSYIQKSKVESLSQTMFCT